MNTRPDPRFAVLVARKSSGIHSKSAVAQAPWVRIALSLENVGLPEISLMREPATRAKACHPPTPTASGMTAPRSTPTGHPHSPRCPAGNGSTGTDGAKNSPASLPNSIKSEILLLPSQQNSASTRCSDANGGNCQGRGPCLKPTLLGQAYVDRDTAKKLELAGTNPTFHEKGTISRTLFVLQIWLTSILKR